MTLTLADPLLAQLLANAAPAPIVVDWLEQREPPLTLADVLTLYAGTWQGGWTDGLSQEVLAEWCRRTEPERRMWEVRTVDDERFRCVAVLTMALDVNLFADILNADPDMQAVSDEVFAVLAAEVPSRLNDPRIKAAEQRARAIVERDRRRRTLELFPEVEARIPIESDLAIASWSAVPVATGYRLS